MDTKILIGMPCNRLVKPKTVEALANMIAFTSYPTVTVVAMQGYTTAENRNYLVMQAMKNDCTHILFVDDDMTFPQHTLDHMLQLEKEIVGVASNSRTLPLSPTVGLMDKDGNYKDPAKNPPWEMKLPEELFKAYFVGGGVLLIDMKVFKTIDKPWFKFEANDDGLVTTGEDGWFCKQAREKGFDIWCDPTITIGHIGDYTY